MRTMLTQSARLCSSSLSTASGRWLDRSVLDSGFNSTSCSFLDSSMSLCVRIYIISLTRSERSSQQPLSSMSSSWSPCWTICTAVCLVHSSTAVNRSGPTRYVRVLMQQGHRSCFSWKSNFVLCRRFQPRLCLSGRTSTGTLMTSLVMLSVSGQDYWKVLTGWCCYLTASPRTSPTPSTWTMRTTFSTRWFRPDTWSFGPVTMPAGTHAWGHRYAGGSWWRSLVRDRCSPQINVTRKQQVTETRSTRKLSWWI